MAGPLREAARLSHSRWRCCSAKAQPGKNFPSWVPVGSHGKRPLGHRHEEAAQRTCATTQIVNQMEIKSPKQSGSGEVDTSCSGENNVVTVCNCFKSGSEIEPLWGLSFAADVFDLNLLKSVF